MKPDRESASHLAEVLADEPDFATEHCDLTVGDDERGGPEGIPEPESPKGYGGADIHRSRRHRGEHKAVVMALRDPRPAPSPTPPAASAAPLSEPTPAPVPDPTPAPLTDPAPDLLPDAEPDFALEHRHLTVGGSDAYRTRRD